MIKTLLSFHPISEIFPLMDDKGIDDLAEDIRKNGQQEVITLCDGMILDGRNRYTACRKLNIEPNTCTYDGKDPLSWVMSLNFYRRHLNESQRSMVADRAANLRVGQTKDHKKNVDSSIELPDTPEPPISQADAAKRANVSVASVKRARIVNSKGSTEVIKAVDEGKLSVNAASKIAKEPKEKQDDLLRQRTDDKASRPKLKKGREEKTKDHKEFRYCPNVYQDLIGASDLLTEAKKFIEDETEWETPLLDSWSEKIKSIIKQAEDILDSINRIRLRPNDPRPFSIDGSATLN